LIDHGNLEYFDADEIREHFLDAKPTVSQAIFPLEDYKGTFSGDLFTEDEERYFDDMEQFLRLQTCAVEEKVVALETEGYAPVEVVERFQDWKYREAEESEQGGAWIVFNRLTGHVEVHQALVLEVSSSIDEETKPKAKPTSNYSASLYRYMAMHKSMAVQAGLLLNPRKAKEVAVMRLGSLPSHQCVSYFDDPDIAPAYWHTMDTEAQTLLEALGELPEEGISASQSLRERMQDGDADRVLYAKVTALSDALLDRLYLLLTTLTFGQLCPEIPDTDEKSLFNRVALDLGADMSTCWVMDEDFLSRRNKAQLAEIVEMTQTGHLFGNLLNGKKRDLVRKMVRHFAQPSEALRWIPEAMYFPAVDPNAQTEVDAS